MTQASIVWLILLIVFALVEALTVGLVSIWFAIGAVGALVTSAFTDNIWAQVVVFVFVSAIALVITRPLVQKLSAKKAVPTNADRNVGRKGIVLAPISVDFPGRVRVDGVDWNAACTTPLAKDSVCIVTAVDGTTLTVIPEKEPQQV